MFNYLANLFGSGNQGYMPASQATPPVTTPGVYNPMPGIGFMDNAMFTPDGMGGAPQPPAMPSAAGSGYQLNPMSFVQGGQAGAAGDPNYQNMSGAAQAGLPGLMKMMQAMSSQQQPRPGQAYSNPYITPLLRYL